MPLPKINSVPKYSLTVPSTKQKVTFRPFLVKEQKVLLMALESQDQQAVLRAIIDTIDATCDDVNINKLATFDVEYMFTQIRGKSAGESVDLNLKCSECEDTTEVKVLLDDITIDVNTTSNVIQLTDVYQLYLRYPTYQQVLASAGDDKTIIENLYHTALMSMEKLVTEEEQILFDEESEQERLTFLENLNQEQMNQILEWVQKLPKLSKDIEFACKSCHHENKIILEGIADFFS